MSCVRRAKYPPTHLHRICGAVVSILSPYQFRDPRVLKLGCSAPCNQNIVQICAICFDSSYHTVFMTASESRFSSVLKSFTTCCTIHSTITTVHCHSLLHPSSSASSALLTLNFNTWQISPVETPASWSLSTVPCLSVLQHDLWLLTWSCLRSISFDTCPYCPHHYICPNVDHVLVTCGRVGVASKPPVSVGSSKRDSFLFGSSQRAVLRQSYCVHHEMNFKYWSLWRALLRYLHCLCSQSCGFVYPKSVFYLLFRYV